MQVIPPLARLSFLMETDSPAEALQSLIAAIHEAHIPEVQSWKTSETGKARTGGFKQWVDKQAKQGSDKKFLLLLEFGEQTLARLESGNGSLAVNLSISVDDQPEMLPDALKTLTEVVRKLAASFTLRKVKLVRDGQPGLLCIPLVPLVLVNSHIARVTEKEVSDAYDAPEPFYSAWETQETINGQQILTRGLEKADNRDYLKILLDSQWTMARTAKPGKTKYLDLILEDYEEEIYRAGSETVRPVAHIDNGNIVEVTCVPPDGEFIRGWEIYNLRHLIQSGELDGDKVDTVRVVFTSAAIAEANKRPLLDIGASVAYMDDSGELAYITE